MGRRSFLLSTDPLPNQGERRAQCPEMIELPRLAWLLSSGGKALFLEFDRVEHDPRFGSGESAGERFDCRPTAAHLAGTVDEAQAADWGLLMDPCPEPLEDLGAS